MPCSPLLFVFDILTAAAPKFTRSRFRAFFCRVACCCERESWSARLWLVCVCRPGIQRRFLRCTLCSLFLTPWNKACPLILTECLFLCVVSSGNWMRLGPKCAVGAGPFTHRSFTSCFNNSASRLAQTIEKTASNSEGIPEMCAESGISGNCSHCKIVSGCDKRRPKVASR